MAHVPTDVAFTSSEEWIPVSPKLVTARRITLALATLPVVAVIIVLFLLSDVPNVIPTIATTAMIVIFGWAWWLIGRRVRSYAYCERDDDLLVSSGILFRRLVIVPYGRMQLVDVTAGPIDRALGVTTVQLHTAAATTDASIPGLKPSVAADLRDRLAHRGETRSAGL